MLVSLTSGIQETPREDEQNFQCYYLYKKKFFVHHTDHKLTSKNITGPTFRK